MNFIFFQMTLRLIVREMVRMGQNVRSNCRQGFILLFFLKTGVKKIENTTFGSLLNHIKSRHHVRKNERILIE